MSDDEYYGEYDDFEDGLWDADPTPDLADDLAEHAAHSPVWQDDPVGELEPYHSDWEYYSDDYYDDDPALKNTTLDGSVSAPISKISPRVDKRGRKRKLDEAREPRRVAKKGSLVDCIRGTVWAKEEQEKRIAFQLGQQGSVALLKNWREIFKSDRGASHTFGRGQLKRDESWANDLSLADMGLLNDREKSGVPDDAHLDDEEEEGGLMGDEEDMQDLEDLDTADETEQLLETPQFKGNEFDHASRQVAGYSFESDTEHMLDDTLSPRKRRKLAGLPSPPVSNKSNGTAAFEAPAKVLETQADRKATSKQAGGVVRVDNSTTERVEDGTALARSAPESAAYCKKRKLSVEAEENKTPASTSNKRRTQPTTSTRLLQ